MSSAAELTQYQYQRARFEVASVMDQSNDPDAWEKGKAERLLDAGFIDLAALGLEGVA